jgi:hypothetical protein
MKLRDVPLPELRASLAATERLIGPDAFEVRVLRREIERRERSESRKVRRDERKQRT